MFSESEKRHLYDFTYVFTDPGASEHSEYSTTDAALYSGQPGEQLLLLRHFTEKAQILSGLGFWSLAIFFTLDEFQNHG